MNIPYGCVMVAVNESLKRALRPAGDYDIQTFILAGSGAGAIAAAATNPLDVVKTRLQTQALRATSEITVTSASAVEGRVGGGLLPQILRSSAGSGGGGGGGGGGHHQHGVSSGFGTVLGVRQGTGMHIASSRCATGRCGADKPVVKLQYQGLLDAVRGNKITVNF